MKKSLSIVAMLLLLISISAKAATDRSYYVTELAAQSKMDIYNDGKNTYIENVPGLVITGATADATSYIVIGLPSTIRGFMNGKPITIARGLPPAPPAAPAAAKAQVPTEADLTGKLGKLNAELAALQTMAAARGKGAAANGDAAPAVATRPPVAKAPSAEDVYLWKTSSSDVNLRFLIERWSKSVGWNPIWEVERDIPIISSDEVTGDFRRAVRQVLLSTEFGDIQLKPCFHTNKVVRIVRKTAKCNPSE